MAQGRAVVVTAPRQFEIVDLPIPEPAEDEVLIEVKACATCTNWEVQTWQGTDIFDRPGHPIYPQNPGSPGHEASGVVVGLGSAIKELVVGDHVAVYGSIRGPENDAHATHITRPEHLVAKLDPAIPFVDAAPLEMAQCAVRSIDLAGDLAGKSVGVVGLGPAGLLHLQAARAAGSEMIVAVDMVPQRLAVAAQFADVVVNAADDAAVQAAVQEGVQVAYDCSGHPVGMKTALGMAREAFHCFSVPHGSVEWGKLEWLRSIPILPYHWRGDTQVNCLRRSAKMLAEGKFNTRAIITDVLPYTRYAEGMERLLSKDTIKIVFEGWE